MTRPKVKTKLMKKAKKIPAKVSVPTPSRSSPRAPSRDRGIRRFGALVDATEALLNEHSPDSVGLYQIAKKAGVPPASIYHFFPTKEAAFVSLAQRYLEGFIQILMRPVDASALRSWQDLMAWDQRQAVDYYNNHPPALKLLFGGYGGTEARQLDIIVTERIARAIYSRLNTAFHLPFLRDPYKKFHISVAIMDSIWSLSYVKNGVITQDYYNEALSASIAYCGLFLPEHIELRDDYREKAQRKEAVVFAEGGE